MLEDMALEFRQRERLQRRTADRDILADGAYPTWGYVGIGSPAKRTSMAVFLAAISALLIAVRLRVVGQLRGRSRGPSADNARRSASSLAASSCAVAVRAHRPIDVIDVSSRWRRSVLMMVLEHRDQMLKPSRRGARAPGSRRTALPRRYPMGFQPGVEVSYAIADRAADAEVGWPAAVPTSLLHPPDTEADVSGGIRTVQRGFRGWKVSPAQDKNGVSWL